MALPHVNYLAVLVSGIAIFMLGGLWYSPVLFAKPWVRLMGKTEEELRAQAKAGGAGSYFQVFLCGLVTALVMAIILAHVPNLTVGCAICVAALCWLGFAAATSYGSGLFSGHPFGLWLINSGYNLVAFVVAAIILALWR
jgi:hypothetical protein